MQFHQGGTLQGQDMRQFQEACVGKFQAQLLDDAQADAAAAVDRLAGGLVDHQQAVVAVDHPLEQGLADPGQSRNFLSCRHPNRRDAHFVALLQLVIGFCPAAGDAHLAFPQHPVNPALGYALEASEEVIVQALSGFLCADPDFCYSDFAGGFH